MNVHEANMLFVALRNIARPIILERCDITSCIISTRVGINVLRHFGIGAKPLPVKVLLFNPEAAHILATEGPEEFKRQVDAMKPEDEGGPWSIGLGARPTALDVALNKWSGHLIIEIPKYTTYMDLSFDQASRPHKNLDVTPHYFTLEPDDPWVTGQSPVMQMTATDGTVIILDRNCPDPDGYRQSNNWTGEDDTQPLIDDLTNRTIEKIEEWFAIAGEVYESNA